VNITRLSRDKKTRTETRVRENCGSDHRRTGGIGRRIHLLEGVGRKGRKKKRREKGRIDQVAVRLISLGEKEGQKRK